MQATMNVRVADNQISPINRLPLDLLVPILTHAAASDQSTMYCISEVCVYWHEVVTNTPLFWTSIPLSKETPRELTELFAKRSDPCAVKFHYSTPKGVQKVDVNTLWQYQTWKTLAHRAKDVHLTLPLVSPKGDCAITAWFAGCNTPELRHLTLAISKSAGGRKSKVPIITSPLAEAPLLQSLTLVSFRLPWASGQYARLKKLHITFQSRPDWQHSMDESFLHMFRESPLLEDLLLHISDPINQASTTASRVRQDSPIQLKEMKVMDIDLTWRDAAFLFSSIALPESCYMSLNILYPESTSRCLPCDGDQVASLRHIEKLFIDCTVTTTLSFYRRKPEGSKVEPRPVAVINAGYIWRARSCISAMWELCSTIRKLHPTNCISRIVLFKIWGSTDGREQLPVVRGALENPNLRVLVLDRCHYMTAIVARGIASDCLRGSIELVFRHMAVEIDALLKMCISHRTKVSKIELNNCKLRVKDAQYKARTVEKLQEMYGEDLQMTGTA